MENLLIVKLVWVPQLKGGIPMVKKKKNRKAESSPLFKPFLFFFEAELHAVIVSAGETHLFLQRESQSLTYQALNHPTYVPWLPTSRLTKQARSSLVT